MKTGLSLIYTVVGYMILIFVVFAFLPTSTFQVQNAQLNNTIVYNYNGTQTYTAQENIDVFDVFTGLFSFGITGASVPWWISIIAVYFPLFLLGLGVYGIIRGI